MATAQEILAWIESESAAFAATIRPDTVDRRVPSCPAWALRDLAGHLGHVQRFWADAVRVGRDVEPEFPTDESAPADAIELEAWMRASTRELLDALRATPWDTAAWTWWKETRTVGAIARHQAQEAAVHRWDAQSAVGAAQPLPVALAGDGVDEFLWIARQFRDPAPIAFVALDTGREFALSDGPAAVTASASAADLVLLLYGRVPLDAVSVEGDRAVLAAALMPIE